MRRRNLESRVRRLAPARRSWLAMICLSLALGMTSPAAADPYDDSNSGHPLRIIAYVLHPVGVIIDYALLRPAHWFVSIEPMKTLFGHEDD